jgi:hypothetical protein
MNPRITLILPTKANVFLEKTLESMIKGGFSKGDDDAIVVGDGPCLEARRVCEGFKQTMKVSYLETVVDNHGNRTRRQSMMPLVTGTHLMSAEERDIYAEDAFRKIRGALSGAPDRIHIWHRGNEEVTPDIRLAEFIVPHHVGLIGSWGYDRDGGTVFLSSTLKKWPHEGKGAIVWHRETLLENR